MIDVSILVAVYNVESYLAQCLDSLLNQTLGNIQIICVDDCSTDGSMQLLKEYARRDQRIEVYQMAENGGQAKARNEAVRHARGRYIAFLDSDDWLAADALERCVEVFDQHPATDCVLMRVLYTDEQGHTKDYAKPIPPLLKGYDAFVASLDWSIHGWYVARREFYEQWPYDETCKSYSDDNITRQHYYHAREVRYAPQSCYFYRCYTQSVTRAPSPRRFDYLRATESMKEQLKQLAVPKEIKDSYENQRWLVLIGVYMFYHVHGRQLSADDRRWGLSELRRSWESIDATVLDRKTASKFGYRHCRRWWLFRLQEWAYFTLRGLLGKNE